MSVRFDVHIVNTGPIIQIGKHSYTILSQLQFPMEQNPISNSHHHVNKDWDYKPAVPNPDPGKSPCLQFLFQPQLQFQKYKNI